MSKFSLYTSLHRIWTKLHASMWANENLHNNDGRQRFSKIKRRRKGKRK